MVVGIEPSKLERSSWWLEWARCGCRGLTGQDDGQDRDDADAETSKVLHTSSLASLKQTSAYGSVRRSTLTPEWPDDSAAALGKACRTSLRSNVSLMDEDPEAFQAVITKLKSFPRFILAVRNYQRSIAERALREGPNHVELDRGIHIEPVYDFYDPSVRKIRLRKMDAHLVHRRETGAFPGSPSSPSGSRRQSQKKNAEEQGAMDRVEEVTDDPVRVKSGLSIQSPDEDDAFSPPLLSPTGSEKDADCGSRPMSRTSSKSSTASRGDDGDVKAPPTLGRSASLHNRTSQELIATWGAMCGKLMHSQVIDIRKVAHATRHKTKGKKEISVMRSVKQRALQVVGQVERLVKRIGKATVDEFDSEWSEPDLLKKCFGREQYTDTLMLIAKAAGKVVSQQPVLAETDAPCRVFGDIHGQLRDLLILFHAFGTPHAKSDLNIVFNGDFVDRGSHQLCVVGILFALKVAFPDKIWLVRGNHEDKTMNEKYGFYDECLDHLGSAWGPKVFQLVQSTFNHLPLACLIGKRVLCVHGGIGDGKWSLQDLLQVRRPLNEDRLNAAENRWVYGILWSDPIEDGEKPGKSNPTFGVHPSPRGKLATKFGWNVTKTFCARNGLSLVVRSHQSKHNGVGFEVMHENLLMRVFSARDYEGHGNDGAVLYIKKQATERDAEHLVVRPQVVRSATKARREQTRRRAVDMKAAVERQESD